MEFGVFFTCPATPSLFLAPMPAGQLTDVPFPTLLFHSGLTFDRKSVQQYVVPLPSERWTTTISAFGNFTLGFPLASFGSFHLVILPRKISARDSPVKFRP